jgi:drug/metabolite transporter (DMT)-like permease
MVLVKKFSCWFTRRKYEILVFSFMLLIFGNTFSHAIFLAVLLPLQNMLTAFVIFYHERRTRITIGCMIISVIVMALINCCEASQLRAGIILVIYFLYFVLISVKVYTKIFKTDRVSADMLSILICGFILLCLTNAIIFITIEINFPHSYSHIVNDHHRFDDLVYFSFTTVLTIGYGDILPLTLLARRSVMLAGLTGHLYTVLVTGIIIGKYLQNKGE